MSPEIIDQEPQTPTPRPTTPAGDPIYRVPESNLETLKAKVAKLNKRATKLKMAPLVLTEIGEEFEKRKKTVSGYDALGRPNTVEYEIRFVLVTLTGKSPRVNGWAMAATIQHEDGGNILRTVPGFETNLPLKYRTCATNCDHCGYDRKRNDTYVLQSEQGEWKQVGRNCLADFLRTDNPSGIAEWAEILASLDSEIGAMEEEGFGGSGSGVHYYPTVSVLTQVACVIRADGWCSRTEARANHWSGKTATVDTAMSCFDHKWWAKQNPSRQQALTPTEDDKTRAIQAIEWAQALPEDVSNDYLWNIRVVSHRERITYREAGLVGSIVAAYNRAMEQELKKKYEQEHPSNYFGTEGKREQFTLTVIGLRDLSNDFGPKTMIRFRDPNGNKATWFAAGTGNGWELDQTYTVKATVKKHEEYKGSKQTLLQRVAKV